MKIVFVMEHQKGEELDENLFKPLEEIFRSQCSFLRKTSLSLVAAGRITQRDESNPKSFLKHVSNSFVHRWWMSNQWSYSSGSATYKGGRIAQGCDNQV